MTRLNFITTDPPNAGTPIELLDGSPLTPDDVYLRNNFAVPERGPDHVHVAIPGRRFVLTLADLKAMPSVEIPMVLECAGNGRTFMDPVPDGTPWDMGAVSPVIFEGVELPHALGAIPDEVTELVFTGIDSGEVSPGHQANYQFSLERPVWDRAILALRLGGRPLGIDHGGPIRLVVPGHYGMKSVKWVATIEGVNAPFRAHFVDKYRYLSDDTVSQSAPVREIRVRSLIASPQDNEQLAGGRIEVVGSAWTGTGAVTTVEISVDGGEAWFPTKLSAPPSEFAPVTWSTGLDLAPGDHEIMARATDSGGNIQPLQPRWNINGYGNNVVHRVRFQITSQSGQ